MAEQGADDDNEKSEAPTQRRIDKAREDGQVAMSRELTSFAALLAGSLAVLLVLPSSGAQLLLALRGLMSRLHEIEPLGGLRETMAQALLAILPVAAAVAVAAVAATLLQSRGLVSGRSLRPQASRLSPLAGIKRILGPDGLVEFARTLAKLGFVGLALWFAIDEPTALLALLQESPARLLERSADQGARLLFAALAAFAVIALLDLLYVRWRHLQKLRMSRQDLREELKETDGSPELKARRRQIQRSRARRRMVAAVQQATVVVTNPTHYAVALAYEPGGAGAPLVVAKGVDAVAARIREAAEAAGVPLVANPPLARALFRVELDEPIPAEHYAAVAEIIAFVWRARRRA